MAGTHTDFDISQRVTIVGLGLMGGSMALALRPYVKHLTAVDTHPATLARALSQGMIDVATTDLAEGVRRADLVILATPVGTILRLLAELPHLRPEGCLVLDLGSTKAQICRAMAAMPSRFQVIGGHPMCGRETAGLAAAAADLYQGQTFILCRTSRTTPPVEQLVLQIVSLIGAQPLFLAAERHDELVALTSHLPYLVAAILMQQASRAAGEEGAVWQVSASGFYDTTRLSGSNAAMMLDILLTNQTAVLFQLEQYQANLTAVIALLKEADPDTLAAWLAARQAEQVAYREKRRGEGSPRVAAPL